MSDFNQTVIDEFRANAGKVGGYFANNTLLLLHTTGARSGKARINPLITIEDGDRLVIAASNAGGASNPAWYYNVIANPVVYVEYGTEAYQAQATVASEPERTELYEKMAAVYDNYAEYKAKTTRTIPIVTLTRLS